MESIAVVGGSNGGYAAAADLADRGFAVDLYVRTPGNHERVLAAGELSLVVSEHYEGPRRTPGDERRAELASVTTDIGAAVAGADLVLVPLPTTTQRAVAADLLPHLADGQVVVLAPGNFGSYLFAREHAALPDPAEDVVFAETPTLPYVTRKSGPAEVTINLDAVALPVGAFPGEDTDRAHRVVAEAYGAALPAENALDCALNNSNPCVNATPTVLNAGAIECEEFDRFNVHRHGVGPGVYAALRTVDAERVRLREELSFGPPHFTQDEYYRPESADGEHFYGRNARAALTSAETFSRDPPSLDDRYVHEDVAIATVLLSSLGAYLGVETPTVDAVVRIASELVDEPFAETGRTLERLGLDSLSRGAFEERLARGVDR